MGIENRFEKLVLVIMFLTIVVFVSIVAVIELYKFKIISNSEQPIVTACILGSKVENLKMCSELSKQ